MLVELHLIGTDSRWRLSTPQARMGRDPGCEVALSADQYPMVSREHAILTMESGRVRLSDNQSTNGTLVNGIAISNAMLTKLDRFRLGKDGPEFEIQVIDEQPAALAPTVVTPDVQAAMATRVAVTDPAFAPTRIGKPAEQPRAPSVATTAVKKPETKQLGDPVRTTPVSLTGATSTREEEEMIEQKLSSLRNLVYLLIAMVAVLLGVIFYQSQQIDKNRTELNDMRKQAQSAVAQFTPQLDQRLNALDKRLDQAEARMKATEDEFMTRLNRELPRMLDRYVDRKIKELSAAAPQIKQ
jgi:pSer/pThr/pTyr-binding forkhead associated (FHA) protein